MSIRPIVLCLALIATPLLSPVGAQSAVPRSELLTGACVPSDTAINLDSLVEQPDQRAMLAPHVRLPAFPDTLRRPGYDGTVTVGFIVDADGRVRPGTSFVTSSTDPVLSRWACDATPNLRFEPAKVGRKSVATQVLMPFTYRGPPLESPTPPAPPNRR